MTAMLIRYFVYAAVMAVGYGMLQNLYTRDGRMLKNGQTDTRYRVAIPPQLGWVYGAMFVLGMVMFIAFLIFHLSGVESATIGLMRFALIFAAIGLAVALWSKWWVVLVSGPQMKIRRLFRRTKVVNFSEIDKVEITKKGAIKIYRGGRVLTKVNLLCDNYERFEDSLTAYGKLKKEHQ